MATNLTGLPEGFIIDQAAQQPQQSALPEGFTIDQPTQQQPSTVDLLSNLGGGFGGIVPTQEQALAGSEAVGNVLQSLLPAGGGLGGAAGGAALGTALAPGPGTALGAILGGAFGAGTGETAKQGIEIARQQREELDPAKIGIEAALGAGGEALGFGVKGAALAGKALAKTRLVSGLSRVPTETLEQAFKKGSNVFEKHIGDQETLLQTTEKLVNDVKSAKVDLSANINSVLKTLPNRSIQVGNMSKQIKNLDRTNKFFDTKGNLISNEFGGSLKGRFNSILSDLSTVGGKPKVESGILGPSGTPLVSQAAVKGGKANLDEIYNFIERLDDIIEYQAPGNLSKGEAQVQVFAQNLRGKLSKTLKDNAPGVRDAFDNYSEFMRAVNTPRVKQILQHEKPLANVDLDLSASKLKSILGPAPVKAQKNLSKLERLLMQDFGAAPFTERVRDTRAAQLLSEQLRTGSSLPATIIRELGVRPSIAGLNLLSDLPVPAGAGAALSTGAPTILNELLQQEGR